MKRITVAITWLIFGCGPLLGCLNPDEAGNLVPKTVAEDPRLPAIEVNGTRLHAETFGDPENPIIVFNHGGPGSDYRAMISAVDEPAASRYPQQRDTTPQGLRALEDDFYCVFYDQRGGGLSPRSDAGEVSFDLLVEDLHAIIDHALDEKERLTGNRDRQVILFGWSFGGVLVTGYTNRYPDRVRDVITYEHGPLTKDDFDILDITTPFEDLGSARIDEWLYSARHVSNDSHARAGYQMYVGVNRSAPELHEHPRTPFWRVGALVTPDIDDFGSAIAGRRLVDNLSAFEGRFLYLYGALTTALNAAGVEQYASHYPNGRIVEIPGTGHSGPWEKSAAVVGAIRTFLAEGE